MGGHSWRRGARRPVRARLAALAALVVTAGSVVVGVGFAEAPESDRPLPVPAGLDSVRADLPLLDPDASPSSSASAAQVPVDGAAPASGAPATQAQEPAAADPASAAEGLVAGTPCTPTAKACVDLAGRRAWLLDGDRIVRGPVGSRHGSRDEPTPVGTFTVQWKAEQYTSREYGTPMPFSVFFAPGGVAFHEGRQDTPSAGCVKLAHDDAVAFFGYLQVGDEVQVH